MAFFLGYQAVACFSGSGPESVSPSVSTKNGVRKATGLILITIESGTDIGSDRACAKADTHSTPAKLPAAYSLKKSAPSFREEKGRRSGVGGY